MSYKGFTQVELRKPSRSTFNLSHEKRISSRIGRLTPVLITETMPNDTFHGATEVLVKLAPMIAPIYHRLNLYVHYFFVPNRLLWKDWETFITGGRLGAAVTAPPVPPRFDIAAALGWGENLLDKGSIADYLGVPPIVDADAFWETHTLDAMPFAAVYRCWFDYYRDRNFTPDENSITNQLVLPLASGDIGEDLLQDLLGPRIRCWEHDYFTSALPFTQRGAEVLMPLSGSGTVTYNTANRFMQSDGGGAGAGGALGLGSGLEQGMPKDASGELVYLDNIQSVDIDSSDVSINDLRRAIRLQEWLERNALAGSRYNESIMAHFGRKTSDSRLQRAEYLGGGKAVIQISEVMTTAFSVDDSVEPAVVMPPGNPVGRGSSYSNTNSFTYNCEEHGFIVGILSVMPTSGYMQGLPRMFQNRNTFLEYPWPSFAHLGEQEVFDNEIYMDVTSLPADRTNQPLFGYQSRYADWKYIPSSCHGDFRQSLDFWHLTRKFASTPNLDAQFVTFEDELQDRVFNVSDVDTLWMYVYNKMNVKRSLPYFGTPML